MSEDTRRSLCSLSDIEFANKRIEATPCPSCGRKTLQFWQDPCGAGGQCTSKDCLEMYEVDELEIPQ